MTINNTELVQTIKAMLEQASSEERHAVLKGFASNDAGRGHLLAAIVRGNTIRQNNSILGRSSMDARDLQRLGKACFDTLAAPLLAMEDEADACGYSEGAFPSQAVNHWLSRRKR